MKVRNDSVIKDGLTCNEVLISVLRDLMADEDRYFIAAHIHTAMGQLMMRLMMSVAQLKQQKPAVARLCYNFPLRHYHP